MRFLRVNIVFVMFHSIFIVVVLILFLVMKESIWCTFLVFLVNHKIYKNIIVVENRLNVVSISLRFVLTGQHLDNIQCSLQIV
jgi:hypothetical protein